MNVMALTFDHYLSGSVKTVSANLGSPTSMADFGSRITYAPKYLLAIMFGISIQTDNDAFGTGINKNNQIQHEGNNTNSTANSSNAVRNMDSGNGNISNLRSNTQPERNTQHTAPSKGVPDTNPVANNVQPTEGTGVEHSKSYPVAKSFITNASSAILLDEAERKVTNATGLHDFEKAELAQLIQERRNEVK
jgi:hypothetical protein